MLIYIIDAFNLIYKIEPILDSPAPHGELVSYITKNKLTGSSTNRVVIVFDGYAPKGQLIECPYEIVFSKGKSADDVINEMVTKTKNRRQIVVVSDDHSVRDHARGEGAGVMHTEEFLKRGTKKKTPAKDRNEKRLTDAEREKITRELKNIWR